jgi:hypothetical protein
MNEGDWVEGAPKFGGSTFPGRAEFWRLILQSEKMGSMPTQRVRFSAALFCVGCFCAFPE